MRFEIKTSILITCMSLQAVGMTAQSKAAFQVRGVVTDEQNMPISFASVTLNQSFRAVTDADGQFVIKNLPKAEQYQYEIRYIGFETVKGKISVPQSKQWHIRMKEQSLALEKVTVTAVRTPMESRQKIGAAALQHIQPKTLSDVLQLQPGALTVNPSMNTVSQANIRELDADNANNALGTAILLDGIPVSNDANMQVLSSSKYGNSAGATLDGMNDQTTAGRGVDLRTVSVGNVEEVEVIRGIPSAEYGNLTSGAVLVKTKAGKSPLEIKATADPFSKLVFVSKGWALKHGGALNLGVDWTQSYADTRKKYMGYERVTASAAYSNVFFNHSGHPLSMNVRSSFYSNMNSKRDDPQQHEMDLNYRNQNIGGRVSVGGDLLLDFPWVKRLYYDLAYQVSRTKDSHHNLVSNPDGVVSDQKEPGIHEAVILNKAYYSDYVIHGVPMNFFARLKLDDYIALNGASHISWKLGADFTRESNQGRGLEFSMAAPPQSSGSQTLRPRAFSAIPALNTLSGFAEGSFSSLLSQHQFKWHVGLRSARLFVDQYPGKGHDFRSLEPRTNLQIGLLPEKSVSRLLLTGGFGMAAKMPPLVYLYPDAAYFDNVSLSYLGETPESKLALLTTEVVGDTRNLNLKPTRNTKWEIGLNFQRKDIKAFVTYFQEKNRQEFGYASQLVWAHYDKYQVPAGASSVCFDGQDVIYQMPDGLPTLAEKIQKTEMHTWGMPDNTSSSFKRGIEYGLDLGEWKALRTSLNIDGAWMRIERKTDKSYLNYIDANYDYVPVMPGGVGTIHTRFNTTFRLITHIPVVRLIFTTTIQAVWRETMQNIYQNEAGDPLYELSVDKSRWTVYPEGFYNRDGVYTEWRPEMADMPEYKRMNKDYLLYAFEKEVMRPWVLLNFRLTKELGRNASVSFMANNFPNMSRWYTNPITKSRRQLYPDSYFGAEVKINF